MESARALMGEADSGAYAMRIVIIILHLHASHLGGNRLLRHLLSGGPHRAMHTLLGAIGYAQSDRVVAIDIKRILSTDDYIPVAHSHHMLELRTSRAGIGEDIVDDCAEIIAEIRTERESGERTGDTEVELIDATRALILHSAVNDIIAEGISHRAVGEQADRSAHELADGELEGYIIEATAGGICFFAILLAPYQRDICTHIEEECGGIDSGV